MTGGTDQKREVWLILGPSGAGKSSFGEWLVAERNWLHIEIDRYPDGDGIDLIGLRHEWNEFYKNRDAKCFREAVHRYCLEVNKTSSVLTFPGNLVLHSDHITAALQEGIRTIYLYGSAAHCISAFLKREQQTARNLDLAHWMAHNRDPYLRMSEPVFAPHRIHVFTHTGVRITHTDVFETLLKEMHGGG